MLEKVDVIGDDAHPLWSWLQGQTGVPIEWNFEKFLLDSDGRVVKQLDSGHDPRELIEDF